MELFTTSYRNYLPGMGVPVRISLTAPQSPEVVDLWPSLWQATPRWRYFRKPEFTEQYIEQLRRYGVRRTGKDLHQIAEANGDDRLVLLCHETDWRECHRLMFAAWWMQSTGELVRELVPEPRTVLQRVGADRLPQLTPA